MAEAKRTETYDVNIDKLFDVIVDYNSYPEFMDMVDEIEVLENSDTSAKVSYGLNLIKKFKYTLALTHEKPTKVTWELEDGDLFKSNTGYWELKKIDDNKTEVTYCIDVDFKVFAPKMIVNKVVSSNLPAMMQACVDRAKA
jgi:ribosome-associated toxin RatA of RatAB toxin-antitoxin module